MNAPDLIESRRRIVEVLGTAAFHALGLADSLADERRALESQDMDALDLAVSKKSRNVAELRLVEEQRSKICVQCGFAPGVEQMQHMIGWCDEYAIVAKAWRHLMEVIAECDFLNTTNGAIIRSRKQHVDSSISILRNGQPASTIYNRDGHKPQQHGLRSIAQA